MPKGKWITVNGTHIFVKEGQNVEDAIKELDESNTSKTNVNKKFDSDNDFENWDKEEKINQLNEKLKDAKGFGERSKIKLEIMALERGYNSVEEWNKDKEEKAKNRQLEKENKEKNKKEQLEKEEQNKKQLEEEIKNAPKEKKEMFKIIKKYNPIQDDYHTGIRSPKDIKDFKDTINDNDSFSWGDFSKEDAEKALKTGKITIYSSYPIKQGVFVSTSKKQAEEYSGGKQIYSKTIPLNKVAWINGDEGQFADIEQENFDNDNDFEFWD